MKHVERCRVILHLIDVSESAETPPEEAWRVIEGELSRFSEDLARKPRMIVATKCEGETARARAGALAEAAGTVVWQISAVRREGLLEVLREAMRLARKASVPA